MNWHSQISIGIHDIFPSSIHDATFKCMSFAFVLSAVERTRLRSTVKNLINNGSCTIRASIIDKDNLAILF